MGCGEKAWFTFFLGMTKVALPTAQHGAYHVGVGPVGQPQRPQVELLLELGLLGVQEREHLPDLPATGPQTLVLGVLGAGEKGQPRAGRGGS